MRFCWGTMPRMPALDSLLLFMSAALALNLTPGPDMLYIAARSTSEGRSAGIASVLGITVGSLVHVAALACGLSALLASVPAAYLVVKFAGAAYLMFLGVRALLYPPPLVLETNGPASASLWAVFRQGVLTNVLNPKVALFFLAFVPQFIDASRGSAVAQVLILGLLFNVSGTLVNLAVALGASRASEWLRVRHKLAERVQRATGAVFIALGVRLAVAER